MTLLASVLRASAPGIESHFLLAEGAQGPGLPDAWLPASLYPFPGEVAAAIRVQRPAVVVFDGNARGKPERRARGRCAQRAAEFAAERRCRRGCAGDAAGADRRALVLSAPTCWAHRAGATLARWRYPRVAIRRYATFFARLPNFRAIARARSISATRLMPWSAPAVAGMPARQDRFGAAATLLARDGSATLAMFTPAQALGVRRRRAAECWN